MTDNELLSQYVLVSKEEYMNSIKAVQAIEVINDILDRGASYQIPDMIRLILGKKVESNE